MLKLDEKQWSIQNNSTWFIPGTWKFGYFWGNIFWIVDLLNAPSSFMKFQFFDRLQTIDFSVPSIVLLFNKFLKMHEIKSSSKIRLNPNHKDGEQTPIQEDDIDEKDPTTYTFIRIDYGKKILQHSDTTTIARNPLFF